MRLAILALVVAVCSTGCSGSDDAGCASGSCGLTCAAGQYACGGRCIDPLSDAQFCGAASDCSGAAVCAANQACSAGTCVTPTRTVSGRLGIDHWVDAGSPTSIFGAIPDATVSLLVPDGSASGYRVLAAPVGVDGSFSVPDVPVGDYLLRVERPYTTYLDEPSCTPSCRVPVTLVDTRVWQFTTSTPPVSGLVSHRPDLERTAQPTTVDLEITNLDPASIQPSQLYALSSQAGLDHYLARVPAQATEYVGAIDWPTTILPASDVGLPSAARGDVVHVIQRTPLPFPAWPGAPFILTTTRAAQLADLTLVAGIGGTIRVALSDVPLSQSVSLQLAALAFEQVGRQTAPGALPSPFSFLSAGVYAAPHSASYPAPTIVPGGAPPFGVGPTMRLAYVYLGDAPYATDMDLGTIRYGGLAGSSWAAFLRVYYAHGVRHAVPGSARPVEASAAVFSEYASGATPAGKIGPALGPPASPRIEGRNAWVSQDGVGSTPLLSWTAPTLGAPTAYEVTIVPVDPRDRGVVVRLYGVESFRVPPGILQAGHHYYARISALAGPGYVRDMNPNVASVPRHQADCLTALFSP